MKRLMVLAAGLSMVSAAVPARAPGPPSRVMTCAVPVKRGDTAASLQARYGKQARLMKIHAAEGEMVNGMALWPNDPARRIDVFFAKRPGKRVETIRISEPKSRWRIGGLGTGSRLDAVVKANGRPVTVGGFGWDYGGGVDPRGGALARWPGGCQIGLVMDVDPNLADVPDNIFGDGLVMQSNEARLKAARPVVTKIYISWP